MKPIRITAVSYYNTLPFIHGIQNSGILQDYVLNLKVPADCARDLMNDLADLALVPVGALPHFSEYKIAAAYCIGAVKDVKSVLLLSNRPLAQVQKIYLDTDSMTSVNLVKVLAREYWKINPEWIKLESGKTEFSENEGVVLIGDKTFGICKKFGFCYDLAAEWIRFTSLPFVFAVWISKNQLPAHFIDQLNKAFEWGIDNIEHCITTSLPDTLSHQEILDYLKNDISYEFDDRKKQGLDLFLSYLKKNP